MIEFYSVVTVNSEDYYELLGVSRDASEKDIKSAYKKAARKYHPDNTETGSEEIFKKLGEAYDVLKDPQKKTIYDKYGKDGLKGMGGGGAYGGGFNGAGFEDLSDVFSSFFGGGFGAAGGRARSRARQGHDHSVDIRLDFLDAIKEHKKKIRLNPLKSCKACGGKGAEKDTDIVTCSTCRGAGQVSTVQNTILGQIRQATTCPSCNGTGSEIKNPCKPCKGKGLKREDQEVEVTIPAGVYDGATMRLAGMGDAGSHGGPSGDIYLQIHVGKHKNFEREGANVFSQINIGFADAALGTEVDVPTLRGTEKLKIKVGTQAGEVICLKKLAFPMINRPSNNGDHFVKINVVTPQGLSAKEKDLLQELQKLRQDKDTQV